MQFLHRPAIVRHEPGREPVEQVLVASAAMTGCQDRPASLTKPSPKWCCPDAVHDDAGRQRIRFARDRVREFQSAAAVVERLAAGSGPDSTSRKRRGTTSPGDFGLSTDEDRRVLRRRAVGEHVGARRRTGVHQLPRKLSLCSRSWIYMGAVAWRQEAQRGVADDRREGGVPLGVGTREQLRVDRRRRRPATGDDLPLARPRARSGSGRAAARSFSYWLSSTRLDAVRTDRAGMPRERIPEDAEDRHAPVRPPVVNELNVQLAAATSGGAPFFWR